MEIEHHNSQFESLQTISEGCKQQDKEEIRRAINKYIQTFTHSRRNCLTLVISWFPAVMNKKFFVGIEENLFEKKINFFLIMNVHRNYLFSNKSK